MTIPGLCTQSGGTEPNRTFCIGSNRSAVSSLALAADGEGRRQLKVSAGERWSEVKEEHRELVNEAKKGAPIADPTRRRPPSFRRSEAPMPSAARGSSLSGQRGKTSPWTLTLDLSETSCKPPWSSTSSKEP